MEYLTNFSKLNVALDREIETIQNRNQEEEQQITQIYNDIKEKNTLTFLEHDEDYIVNLFVQEGLDLNKAENIIKASKFLITTKNKLDENMKTIFENTEQYITTMDNMNSVFNSLKDSIVTKYEKIKNRDTSAEKKKLSKLNVLKQKLINNENLEIIDEKQEVELLFEILSKSTLTEEEKITFAKEVFLSNIKNYSNRNIREEERSESLEKTTFHTINSLQEVNFSFLTEEDKNNLSLLEKIIDTNKEKYNAMAEAQRQYLETVIGVNSNWINDPSYKHYKENLFLCYFNKTYSDLLNEAKEIINMSDEEKEEYTQVFHEDVQKAKNILEEYVQIHNEYQNTTMETKEMGNSNIKQHLIFLMNDNNIPYIASDIENADKIVAKDTIKTLEKLRLGQNSSKNTNYSNQFYTTNKVLLYREFCSSGVIEVAYVPLDMENLFIIGACNNGRDNLNDTKKIDRVIGNRLQSDHYFDQLNINRTLLQNEITKENIREEHEMYFNTIKENPRIK